MARLNETFSSLIDLAENPFDELASYRLSKAGLTSLADFTDTLLVMQLAAKIRDCKHSQTISYSKNVFIPLTHLCRDVCHYCTFAKTPKFIEKPFIPVDDIIATVNNAKNIGCKEVLFTLGEKPELRYKTARDALDQMGFATTIDYVAHVAEQVVEQTGLMPHLNPGTMTLEEIKKLRPYAGSMGIMLESVSDRLCEKGMPHYGSPDKAPKVRLETIRDAGIAKVPFTTGILIGIGETRLERLEALMAIRDLHDEYGHIQEVIIQNFRAKPNTIMHNAPEPDLNELLWTLSAARLILGTAISVQVPPNLSPGILSQLVDAGIDDWGGVSPVTPDFVNPEAPWPEIVTLSEQTAIAGKALVERMTLHPDYIKDYHTWLDVGLHKHVLPFVDAQGLVKEDHWLPGLSQVTPSLHVPQSASVSPDVAAILAEHQVSSELSQAAIVRLFESRGADFEAVCDYADQLRHRLSGDQVSYVINRNINYTNICYFNCKFCAFSKGKRHENLRGKPYKISLDEIERRVIEADQKGASEITLQGGIHPDYDGNTYLDICRAVKSATPDMHIHGFTPLEIWQGAETLGLSITDYLKQLKAAGLDTIPGTAAEVLSDEVRDVLCSDKINTGQWLYVMEQAHNLGIRSTSTIMFGHIEGYQHWAEHLIALRELQKKTQGFTELVPLPFVAEQSPIFYRGQSRKGPSFRESILMHAVSRIALAGFIDNIQASWVKLGVEGAKMALNAGANDLGGTLMNETITKSAGATHGQEVTADEMARIIKSIHRVPRLRNTLYETRQRHHASEKLEQISAVSIQ
ncbi:MAG: 5-amino-6-(D-ribitylamino)uracil--L-tyrosine 4-hydroxyphenyl transferase CofH [Cellvibrionales bacterium]|nr:5-amino-6-(D-ribitylamino)uracil--L-tyrosine 4-hydroxyphenyl transferase CofH [Cellvibrionales bacterium]